VHDDLLARRTDYPVLARSTYLVNNSLGAMHRDTVTRLAEFTGLWAELGVRAWETWVPQMRQVADQVGAILGAPPGSTVLRQNVADVLASVASALPVTSRRNRVVYSDLEWPGSHYLWREHARERLEVSVVPSAGDGVHLDVARVVDAIDERTLIVPISHVLFRSSTVVDVRPVVARAHEVGALVLLDAYQSAGVLPINVLDLDVDFCVGGSVKYLCGGPGAGWLYVAPRLADSLRPANVGWFGHQRPFDFAFDDIDYAPGVARFAGGTPNVPAAYAASAGYGAVLEVGVQRIRERSQSLTQPLVEAVLERGWSLRSPYHPAERGGHVTVEPWPEVAGRSAEVHDELLRRGFVVDHRPGAGLRIGPHFYNTGEECAAVVDEIERIGAALAGGQARGRGLAARP